MIRHIISAIRRWIYEWRYRRAMRELEKVMPSREQLIEMARRNPPPQSWFDEGLDDLFGDERVA